MNQSELEEMRRRLAERSASEAQDETWVIVLAGILFFVLLIVSQFI
jgi:uncharacterized integral membrane protein